MEKPLINLTNVNKVFRISEIDVLALSNISLNISKGEFVSIRGPSGCGKSTLLSILGLLDTKTSGEYWFNDMPVSELDKKSRAKIRNREIGFVFQSFNLIKNLTVLENICLPLAYRNDITLADKNELAFSAMERLKLHHKGTHYPFQLSGGQQQRVAIARAIVAKPALILADEPTGNLDSKSAVGVMEILSELHANGATVCIVTHDPRFSSFSQRIVELFDGRVVSDSPVSGNS